MTAFEGEVRRYLIGIMEQPKLYQKSESLWEIRHQQAADHRILRRIEDLRAKLAQASDERRKIVLRACDDLLGLGAQIDGHRFTLRQHVTAEISRISDDDISRYLFYRYRYDIFPLTKTVDGFPPCLQIEPTSICNYRCVFCYQTDSHLTDARGGHMGMMSLDLFKKIVDEAEGQCEAITLASRGEPLVCKDIVKMLSYLRGKFLGLKINTNASLLDEEKAHAILQAGPNTLVFSADAAEEPLYSQLRVNGKLERVVKNVEMFQKIRSLHYPTSRVITRVSGVRYSKDQNLDRMEAFWGGLVDQVAFVDYNPWENTYRRPVNDVETPCSDLWRRMFVWWDGTVNPCDVDYLSTLAVGNVKDTELSSLWQGEKYSAYRESHLARRRDRLSPCSRCTVV
jgi:radical SAM protein with 4Fe4S-binding SPASM domain